MVCVSPGAYAVFFFFSTRRRTRILRSSVFSLACPNHAEWRSVHSPSASSWFSHLEFGQYVMSPLYLAVLVRCFGVLFWRNALSDYGYMFCVSRFHGAVLGLVFDMSVGVQQQGFGQTVEKTVGSAVAPLIRGRCPRFAGRADSLVQVWRRQSSPTVAACPYVFLDKVVDMPSLCNGRCLVFGAETADSPHLQFIDKVWTSLRFCSDVSCSGRCHRFSSSPDMVDIPICTETVVRCCDA